jgi:hypothetical protein
MGVEAAAHTHLPAMQDRKKLSSTAAVAISNLIRRAILDKYKHTRLLIPQVRLAHKYPISPWEMIHPPGGDNPVCM